MKLPAALLKLGLVAVALLAVGLLGHTAPASAASNTYTATAGGDGGAPGAFIAVFEPRTLIVSEGDSITWKVTTDEPHTVGLFNNAPPKGITVDNIEDPTVKSPATYDGTSQIYSGLITPAAGYTVKFTKAGNYAFTCLIHPGMDGSVVVVPAGSSVPTQAQDDADGKAAQVAGAAAMQKLLSGPQASATRSAGSGGASTWTIPHSPYAVIPGGYVAQNVFTPAHISIGAGDTVTWVNDTAQAHTVTFLGGGAPAGDPTRPTTKVTSYTGGFASSGLIGNGTPDIFTGGGKYTLTFPSPGSYMYICILHSDQGMVGVIDVGAPGSGAGGTASAVAPTFADVASSGGGALGATGSSTTGSAIIAPAGNATSAPSGAIALPPTAGAPTSSGSPAGGFVPPNTGDGGLLASGSGIEAWPFALAVAVLGTAVLAALRVRSRA